MPIVISKPIRPPWNRITNTALACCDLQSFSSGPSVMRGVISLPLIRIRAGVPALYK
jgi:hypothetical protein